MKRIAVLMLAVLLLFVGCAAPDSGSEYPKVGSADDDARPYYPPEPIPVVVPLAERVEGAVKVTIHKGLLGNDTEVLTDKQKEDGFLDAVRNEDESVTYTIAEDKYDALVERHRSNNYGAIVHMLVNYDSISLIECTDDLSQIDIYAIRDEFVHSTEGEVVFGVGLHAMLGQMYNIDAPGVCVITVYDENNEIIEQTTYPEQLNLS